jgi:hypothetical protein
MSMKIRRAKKTTRGAESSTSAAIQAARADQIVRAMTNAAAAMPRAPRAIGMRCAQTETPNTL